MRLTAEKRHNDWVKAIHKRHIVKDVYCADTEPYDNLHQYSKNKIQAKHFKHKRYYRVNKYNFKKEIISENKEKISETRKNESMNEKENELKEVI